MKSKIWMLLGVLYAPIYILGWILHKLARLILAASYFIMLEKQIGKDIIKSLFNWHGRY